MTNLVEFSEAEKIILEDLSNVGVRILRDYVSKVVISRFVSRQSEYSFNSSDFR